MLKGQNSEVRIQNTEWAGAFLLAVYNHMQILNSEFWVLYSDRGAILISEKSERKRVYGK
ncbi:MAG: hypothetical protein JL50_06735 [Peptococcaceae bacterium BICA1-7]|nr:MAG: hypothetical protein JL50_06735 [Peptococcaceae bacterium BICA1-7]HBV99237.1 hypothetical protein [Desulfotomaculum sp.]